MLLDESGRAKEDSGEHDAQTLALKVAIMEAAKGKPVGKCVIAAMECMIHWSQQHNSNPAFQEGLIKVFEDAVRFMRKGGT